MRRMRSSRGVRRDPLPGGRVATVAVGSVPLVGSHAFKPRRSVKRASRSSPTPASAVAVRRLFLRLRLHHGSAATTINGSERSSAARLVVAHSSDAARGEVGGRGPLEHAGGHAGKLPCGIELPHRTAEVQPAPLDRRGNGATAAAINTRISVRHSFSAGLCASTAEHLDGGTKERKTGWVLPTRCPGTLSFHRTAVRPATQPAAHGNNP